MSDQGPRLALSLVVTSVAGYLDAIGFVQLGHLFVSFMSGNSTHLGMALGTANWGAAAAAFGIVCAFCLGAFLGSLTTDLAGNNALSVLFAVECLILLLACGLSLAWSETAALVAVTAAMGMQNASHQIVAGADIGRSFITGTLFGLGNALAGAVRGKSTLPAAATYLASWTSFITGVVTGGLALATIGLVPSIAAMAVVIGLMTAVSALTGLSRASRRS